MCGRRSLQSRQGRQNTRFERGALPPGFAKTRGNHKRGAYALIAGFLDEVGYRAITATERGSSNEVR